MIDVDKDIVPKAQALIAQSFRAALRSVLTESPYIVF